ncbi:maleylpyruvate isomerase family mycothiol-dependent enzyme [Nonomuraea sp. NPDC050547]|uniref:maleylpyruvate isomerase family mycothiol-dependent enzyme n=1 Tax=Nonomuraea sp. NPDC050547 TaxID=3364368 RepID=UPI0037B265AF
MTDIFGDLEAEYRQLDSVLAALTPAQWSHPSAAEGWTVSDVVLHLAQTEELVTASLDGHDGLFARDPAVSDVDGMAAGLVAAQRDITPDALLARWRAAAFATPPALAGHPPRSRLTWVAGTLSPGTLATTRLAEHWAHAYDVTAPLGLAYPATARLRHIAWLGHRTLPYAFTLAGLEPQPVHCVLTAPDGGSWHYGDPGSPSVITGPAAEFCLVGARRLAPADSTLQATGPHAAQALAVLRNYAA